MVNEFSPGPEEETQEKRLIITAASGTQTPGIITASFLLERRHVGSSCGFKRLKMIRSSKLVLWFQSEYLVDLLQ